MRRPVRPPRAAIGARTRRTAGGTIALAVVAAIAVAGCLPASIRPTPSPGPTPTPSAPPPPTPSPTPGPPTPTPAPTFRLYTVVKGDTLTSIAHRFKTSGRSVAYWNRDTYPSLDPESAKYEPNRLEIGWVLKILPGQEYVPPEDDSETGETMSPPPDEESDSPAASPGASTAP